MEMYSGIIILFLAACVHSLPINNHRNYSYDDFTFISKEGWGGRPPRNIVPLALPVPFVIIHHSYIPRACYSKEECSIAMQSMQNAHQIGEGWDDIGYSFAVGSDGAAYEGRGWDAVGAHSLGYNVASIGIVLIGDWVSNLPPVHQLETTKKLISKGVELGYISPEYTLLGHRQVFPTECPGEALYQEIMTWDRFEHSNISLSSSY